MQATPNAGTQKREGLAYLWVWVIGTGVVVVLLGVILLRQLGRRLVKR